jgi:hypothetical protein
MPGFNLTGAPNTRDYVLGRGVVYLAQLNSTTGLPDADGFRDLGNAPEFNITVNTEDLRHQNSRDCIKFTDKRFVISQEVGISFQLDETRNFENLSDFLSGSTETYNNPHDSTHTDVSISLTVHLGSWYQLRKANGSRVYNLDAVGLVFTIEKDAVSDVLLVEGTDYEIDKQLGLVRFLPTATNVAENDPVIWSITTAASGGAIQDLDQVNALIRSQVSGALMFVQDNAGDCGQKIEWMFHQVSLSADGDLSEIGDEVSVMNFTGVAEINNLVPDTSKVLTVRTYDMV